MPLPLWADAFDFIVNIQFVIMYPYFFSFVLCIKFTLCNRHMWET